jgi:hypothetical protein
MLTCVLRSAHRVKHVLSSGGCIKKAAGGGVGKAEKQAERELTRMHSKKSMHEAYRRGGHIMARGNDSEADMAPISAEKSDTFTEGVRASHRVPTKRGGAIGRPMHVSVDLSKHLHVHPGMMPGGGPPMPAGGPPAGMMAPSRDRACPL